MLWVWLQDQYPAHQIQAHVPQHGPRYEHKNVPFEGTTTNQDAYKAYAVQPHVAMHAPVVPRPYTKFEGTSICNSVPKCCNFNLHLTSASASLHL